MLIAEMRCGLMGCALKTPGEFKVVGFGNLAQDLQSRVQVGQRWCWKAACA